MPTERAAPRAGGGAGLLLALLLALPATGAGFEELLSPGELAEAHAELDGRCGDCHQAMKRSNETPLCLACHGDVEQDRTLGHGLHGRSEPALRSPCRSCHPEHRGRDADLLGLARTTFDHELTDFPLAGAHRAAACASCHEPDAKHRDAPADCVSCHREDDAHTGSLGDDCGSCHEPLRWTGAPFDHASTGFRLEGGHADVACGLCHPSEAYDRAEPACASCHDIDDAHGGRFGAACQDCHAPLEWKRSHFDHERDTRQPLRGAHATASCESCHQRPGVAPATRCNDCHAVDDVHRGTRGVDCQRCHGEDRWATRRFDHAAEAEWPLAGRHAEVDCDGCHVGSLEARLDTRCSSCHSADDAHRGQLGDDCAGCHRPAGWLRELEFDHDLAAFPLLGLHAMVACAECHRSPRFHDTPAECASCHRGVDPHEGRLGPDCQRCHNPNDWALWRFDHATATRFPLDGRHEGLRCEGCHRQAGSGAPRISDACSSCHRRDDAHRGGFGDECQRCHTAESWTVVHFGATSGRDRSAGSDAPGGTR